MCDPVLHTVVVFLTFLNQYHDCIISFHSTLCNLIAKDLTYNCHMVIQSNSFMSFLDLLLRN